MGYESDGKLGLPKMLGYGAGNLAQNMIFMMMSVYLLYFYTDVFKIPAAVAGTIFLVTRMIDSVFDPLMGIIADRTNTKHGRFRPYILFGIFPLAIITVLCFSAPDLGMSGKITYAAITYLLQTLVFSVVLIPYFAMPAVLTQDSHERSKIAVINLIYGTVATLIISAGVKPLVSLFPDEKTGFQLTTMIIALIVIVLFLISFASTKENVFQENRKKSSLKESFGMVLKNTPLLLVSASYIFFSISFTVRLASVVYFIKYNLGKENMTSIFLIVIALSALIGTILSLPLIQKLGKRNAYLISLALATIVNFFILFIPYSNITLLIIAFAINAVALGAPMAATWSMAPDTVEYGEWRTGIRGEGITFGVFSFVQKLASAIGGAASGIILTVIGYVPNAVQSEKTLYGILHMSVTLPLICGIASFIIIYFYKLDDKKLQQMIQEISGRKA